MNDFTFGSVCSGIGAPEVAWRFLGWKPQWFAEIEPFPSAVLAHHWPDVPNMGDMTLLPRFVRLGYVPAPDVLVGGTPCQAYSLAGLRGGLSDPRGQLTLTFVDLANAIDEQRSAAGKPPCIIYWENVPGVLSDATNAFGFFLAGLAGETLPLVAPGGKWPNAGIVIGPERVIAWAIRDAQYFGVAQRRRRVFVVASARSDFDPAAILFEPDGVRRDSAPRRETGQEIAGTLAARTGGGGFPGSDESVSGYVQPALLCASNAEGSPGLPFLTCSNIGKTVNNQTPLLAMAPLAFDCKSSGQSGFGVGEIASTMRAMGHAGSHSNGGGHLAVCVTGDIAHTLKAEGFDASEDGTGRGQPIVTAHAIQAGALRTNPASGPDGVGVQANIAYTLEARAEVQCAQYGMAVRRLTPRECERLQAFPDDYTLVPVERRAPGRRVGTPPLAADGPRYKALGNSMCVNVMRWLGMRLVLTHPHYFN